jgi:hypothetical protein
VNETLRHGATSFPVRTIHVEVSAGPDAGLRVTAETLAIGTAEGSTLRLTDPSVSRFHLTLQAAPDGVHLVDLGATQRDVRRRRADRARACVPPGSGAAPRPRHTLRVGGRRRRRRGRGASARIASVSVDRRCAR